MNLVGNVLDFELPPQQQGRTWTSLRQQVVKPHSGRFFSMYDQNVRGKEFIVLEGELKGVAGEIIQVLRNSAVVRVPARPIDARKQEVWGAAPGKRKELEIKRHNEIRQAVLQQLTQDFDMASTTLSPQECLDQLQNQIKQVLHEEGKKGCTSRMTSAMLTDSLSRKGFGRGHPELMRAAEPELEILQCILSTGRYPEVKERLVHEAALLVLELEYAQEADVFEASPWPSFYDQKERGFMRIFASPMPDARIVDSGLPGVFEIGDLDFSPDSDDYCHKYYDTGPWSFGRCEGASEISFEEAVAPGHDCVRSCHCSCHSFVGAEECEAEEEFLHDYVQPAFARGVHECLFMYIYIRVFIYLYIYILIYWSMFIYIYYIYKQYCTVLVKLCSTMQESIIYY
jgi:hypothetical protein